LNPWRSSTSAPPLPPPNKHAGVRSTPLTIKEYTMTRTDTATVCLLVSAFILGAMLMFKVAAFTENTAHAEMVTNARSVSILTTVIDRQTEMIYVLDSSNEVLLGYMLNNRTEFELKGRLNIGELMKKGSEKMGGGRGTGGLRPR
jgi:hypothetical protein